MNYKNIINIFIILTYTICLAQSHQDKDDDEDNDIILTIGTVIDIYNLFAFILGGGPKEVVIRLLLLFLLTLMIIIILCVLSWCLYYSDTLSYNRRLNYQYYNQDNYINIDVFNLFEWVLRLMGLYYFTGELYTNIDRWNNS